MAKIIINRKREWMNRLRGIKVFIDGKNVGVVKMTAQKNLQLNKELILLNAR
jgi:hypothetical protein